MLAELAAANAAFGILKQTIANGKELMSAGKAISDLINAEEDLRKKGERKKRSFWRNVGGSEGEDLEEFMALESIKAKRAELEQAMIYYGRPGLHSDWIKFQVEARKKRQAEIQRIKKRKQEIMEIGLIATFTIVGGAVVIYFAGLFYLAFRR